MSDRLKVATQNALGLLMLAGLSAMIYGLVGVITGGFSLIPGLIMGAGSLTMSLSFTAIRRLEKNRKAKGHNDSKLDMAHKASRFFAVVGVLGTTAALIAAPFTGGLSLWALYGTLPVMGLAILVYCITGGMQPNAQGVKPTGSKIAGQLLLNLLGITAVVGAIAAVALAIVAIPVTFGGSIVGALPVLAPVITALTPYVTAAASFLGLTGAASAVGGTLSIIAGAVFGGSLITSIGAFFANYKLRKTGGAANAADYALLGGNDSSGAPSYPNMADGDDGNGDVYAPDEIHGSWRNSVPASPATGNGGAHASGGGSYASAMRQAPQGSADGAQHHQHAPIPQQQRQQPPQPLAAPPPLPPRQPPPQQPTAPTYL